MSKRVKRRRRFGGGVGASGPRAERTRAVRALGGRLGGLRQQWLTRSATGWDAHLLTVAHLEVMEASRRWFAAAGRATCVHGELCEGTACLPCLFAEDANETARVRAVRDIIRYGGWGAPEPWAQSRARVCSVRVHSIPVGQAGWALAS
ncbi:hypothetical protein KGQ19_26865 [Catenulispora sp. NL8]|uniref:Uncharacterized protein n=1 Tax=Catenulispora pinistramenti TaxID=2705254 RepID=A0ABS5KWR7_9ACTN|nr:hypothetical protein [Catenulispora pinistramenti]MBS2550498.1 hypothetical protein [Catenulispora pinistramenti]